MTSDEYTRFSISPRLAAADDKNRVLLEELYLSVLMHGDPRCPLYDEHLLIHSFHYRNFSDPIHAFVYSVMRSMYSHNGFPPFERYVIVRHAKLNGSSINIPRSDFRKIVKCIKLCYFKRKSPTPELILEHISKIANDYEAWAFNDKRQWVTDLIK